MSDDHIKVICRIRPANARESSSAGQVRTCLTIPEGSNTVVLNTKPENKSFTFDFTADASVTQDTMFRQVGLPITESCLQGYNGTILCYGQTGSGKTYTIFGNALDRISDSSQLDNEPLRGLVPRVLGHLWGSFKDASMKDDKYTFQCKCSFYEIYQERVFDLLDVSTSPSAAGLSVREDAKEGVYVEGCTEEVVASIEAAHGLLVKGYQNRHVAETNMNRESSRSHAVFQLSLETSYERSEDGIVTRRKSRFSMVDLAGSERQKDTNASGERLKEASVINKSLSTLGHVINTLADVASNGGRKHIHYRDSKLTFLLRDSLGGNSKTTLVATVSPAELCLAETLSTLKFAQRAKSIRNSAVLNEESSGSIIALQKEIVLLRTQLENSTSGITAPSRSFTDDLPLSSLLLALKRCEIAEEQSKSAKEKTDLLNQQLEQAKSSVMGVKYMLKMRESEISRLKKKSTDPVDHEANTEELLKVAATAVKDEMQGEILKLRLEVKEQKQKIQDLCESDSARWTQENEANFNNSLREVLEANMEALERTRLQNVAIAESKFAEEFGFTTAEAFELKDKLSLSERRLEEALGRLPQLQHGVVLLQRMLDEANAESESLKATLEVERAKSEELSMTQCIVEELKRDILAKDDCIKQLEGGLKKSDSELKEHLRQREGEFNDKMNLVMKDNAVLLKRCRELEAAVTEFQTTLDVAVKSREAQKLLVENSRQQLICMETDFAEKIKLFESRIEIANNEKEKEYHLRVALAAKVATFEKVENVSAARVTELESSLQNISRELTQSKFEAENALEDADNLFSQTQALIDERQCLLTSLSDCQSEINELKKELLEKSAICAEMGAMRKQLKDIEHQSASEKEVLNRNVSDLKDDLQTARDSAGLLQIENNDLKARMAAFTAEVAVRRQEMDNKMASDILVLRSEHKEAIDIAMTQLKLDQDAYFCAVKAECDADKKATVEALSREVQLSQALRKEICDVRAENATNLEKICHLESLLSMEQKKSQHSVSELAQAQVEVQEIQKRDQVYNDITTTAQSTDEFKKKLNDQEEQLQQLLAERQLSLSRRIEEASQIKEWQRRIEEADAARSAMSFQLSELQMEHAALCGHQNNKQKIHQHMTLKKDLQDKAMQLNHQQDQIVQLTFERDAARADAARLRKAMRAVEVTSAPGDGGIASSKKIKQAEDKSADTENIQNLKERNTESIIL